MTQRFYNKASVQVAIVLVIGGILSTGIVTWNDRSQLKQDNKSYVSEITNLKQEKQKLTSEVQRLETQLTPFKTIALEKFTGSEQERLQQLADKLDDLQNFVNPFKKPIASATAHVEVTIKSEEDVDTNYMTQGAYLAFVKNRKTLLVTSNKQSTARQTGEGEVVYKADLQMEDDLSEPGQPVEILQTSDWIQIMFVKIPKNSEVMKGKASVVINGDVRVEFDILPQQMLKGILIHNIKDKFLTVRETMTNNP